MAKKCQPKFSPGIIWNYPSHYSIDGDNFNSNTRKGEVMSITDFEGPWGICMQGSTFAATALGRVRVASPMLGHIYTRVNTGTTLIGG